MAFNPTKRTRTLVGKASFSNQARSMVQIPANMLMRDFKCRWHDRHQAPFYRADHAVKIRLEGTGSLPKHEIIAELWCFSQGAFGK
tara:strand:+ start:177 stop:434 length:258 start_codon:yes stop_codon:yes gene_type:complete